MKCVNVASNLPKALEVHIVGSVKGRHYGKGETSGLFLCCLPIRAKMGPEAAVRCL